MFKFRGTQDQQADPRLQEVSTNSWFPPYVVSSPSSSIPATPNNTNSNVSTQPARDQPHSLSHIPPTEAASIITYLKDKRGDYSQWKVRFIDFILRQELGAEILKSIEEGPAEYYVDIPGVPDAVPIIPPRRVLQTDPSQLSEKERNRLKADRLACSYLLQGLPNDIYNCIDSHTTAKAMWDEISKQMQGTKKGARIKMTNSLTTYEAFRAREGELLESTYNRFCNLLNELRKNGIHKTNLEMNIKFLTNLRPEWKSYATNISQNKDLTEFDIHVLYEDLNQNQEEVLEAQEEKKNKDKQVVDLVALLSERRQKYSSRSSKQEKASSGSSEKGTDTSDSDEELKDLKKMMALLTKTFKNRKYYKKPSSNKQRSSSGYKRHEGKEKDDEKKKESYKKYDNKKETEKQKEEVIKCYNCGKPGHYARECRKPVSKNVDYYQNKLLLAKQKAAGKALMAEDEHWLDLTDEDEEEDTCVHLCFMAKGEMSYNSEDDDRQSEASEADSEC